MDIIENSLVISSGLKLLSVEEQTKIILLFQVERNEVYKKCVTRTKYFFINNVISFYNEYK